MNAKWNFFGDKIAWCFFHCDLSTDGRRHMVSIPMQSAIIVTIEKVYFTAGCPYIGMQSDEFKQCTCSALFHTNYKHFGQMTIQLLALFAKQTIFRCDIDFIQPGQWNISDNRINQLNFQHITKVARCCGFPLNILHGALRPKKKHRKMNLCVNKSDNI